MSFTKEHIIIEMLGRRPGESQNCSLLSHVICENISLEDQRKYPIEL